VIALARTSRKPIRLVHLGLGSFFRAHQARLNQLAADGDEWGYAAFTVRSPKQAELLEAQDGLFTLTETSAEGTETNVVDQISAAYAGDDMDALRRHVSDPAVAIVTLTITEGGYGIVEGDALLVRDGGVPASPLARLTLALDARRAAGAGAIAVVPCDNLPENGEAARMSLEAYSSDIPGLTAWIRENVSYCSTAVDRITPRIDDAERASIAEASGYDDASPVVTEHYVEWVIGGSFPAGRPAWETAGVILTGDVTPYEDRKLRMLNGAHTILAIAGPRRGHATVDQAIADPELREIVDAWWVEAGSTLPAELEPATYADGLRERFANPALSHQLSQIAENMLVKIGSRILPVIRERRAAGLPHAAGSRALAEWALATAGDALELDPEHDRAALDDALAAAKL
jgi:fructuronate reductase